MPAPAERTIAGIRCGEVLSRLSEFLDGDIGWPLRDQIIQHLGGCQWCERFGGRFSALIESLRKELGRPAALRHDVIARLRARLSKES